MPLRRLASLLAASLLVLAPETYAEAVTVEGAAPVRNGDAALAREEAIRNALAEAGRQVSLRVDSTLGTADGQLAFERTLIRSAARVHRHQVLAESSTAELYKVTVSAELESADGRPGDSPCREGHVKRLLIGGFPMLRAEQLQMDELAGYAHLTASEIARRFSDRPAIFVAYDGSLMVHFGTPERGGGDRPREAQILPLLRAEAEKHRAQYVLVGRYHSLALSPDKSSRVIDLEALILDPSTGSCVARKRFSRTAAGKVVLPRSLVFGSQAHYATDLGKAYGQLLADVAQWAEATTSCQPFSARVIKAEGDSIYLDAGAEQGIAIGDEFSAFKATREAVVTRSGEILGTEKRRAGEIRVTSVYPRFSIGHRASSGFSSSHIKLEPGDEMYSR